MRRLPPWPVVAVIIAIQLSWLPITEGYDGMKGATQVPTEPDYFKEKGFQDLSEVCSPHWWETRKVAVSSVSILCDDEEESYTSSAKCQPGDMASVFIHFTLKGVAKNATIWASVDTFQSDTRLRVLNRTSICSVGTLRDLDVDYNTDDYYYATLESGYCKAHNAPFSWTLSSLMTVPDSETKKIRSADMAPGLRIQFYSDEAGEELVGCVETGWLAKRTIRKDLQQKGERIFVASVLGVATVLGVCVLLNERKRRLHHRAQLKRKASMMRRFHYIRNNQAGEVLLDSTPPPIV
eukprot:Nitzschia sp. Nitz4//scaffold45_size130396//59703//60671//NITZ4_003449-RA/size130396-snap-gene-0.124-mRNA-1//1//CDS//3329552398//3163//frame0